MEVTPTLDPRPGCAAPAGHPPDRRPTPAVTTDLSREPDAEQMSLARRMRQPRTLISIAVPVAIIAVFIALNGELLKIVPGAHPRREPVLVLVAFVVFYLGFPLRGKRWSILLRGTGIRVGTRTRRRSSSSRGSSIASPPPSSATSTAPTS